jgi:NAD(P)-dependent dehydrogenase (short-subunit alcohol dehydrogenase family)
VKSKVALITGASSGIGAATAERLAKADYKVFGTSRRAAPEAALRESRLPADELFALAADPSVKQGLFDTTERSVARGTFGSPSFYVGAELFFGKDRLREVQEQILRSK